MDRAAKSNRKLFAYIIGWIAVLAIAMVGCAGPAPSDQTEDQESRQTIDLESRFPITVVDDAGNEVTIEREPQSIVSIQASATEIAFALGLGDKIVAVSDYCNYPEEANEKERIGAMEMNAERILQILPDLILATEYHHERYSDILDRYRQAGSNTLVIGDASSFEDAYRHIRMIAQATGQLERAEQIIDDMQSRLNALKEKARAVNEPKKVWIEVSPAPEISTTGKGTFMHEMLEAIRAVNVAGDQEGWVSFTEEQAVNLMPEVIITTYGAYVDDPELHVLNRAGWREVPAVREGRVYDVDNDLVTRPGPRLVDGVETLAKYIYPEIFKE